MTTGGWCACACSVQEPPDTTRHIRRTPTASATPVGPIASRRTPRDHPNGPGRESGASRAVELPGAAAARDGMRGPIGPWSWARLSGAHRTTALGGCSRVPQGPRIAPLRACYPHPAVLLPSSGGFARQGRAVRSGSSCVVPDPSRVARGVWFNPRRGGSSHLRLVSVSAVPLAAASWAVRPGGRRSRACRCSRGRRPNGSDSEAADRRARAPQRPRSGVGGRLTRTRLRHACQLQRPCSLPSCSCRPRKDSARKTFATNSSRLSQVVCCGLTV